jgi:hypothetical protein
MKGTVWTGFVDDAGIFTLDRRRDFAAWVKQFAGREVVLTLKKRPTRQGTQLQRYYRGVVVPDIAEACGYSDPDEYEDVHQGLAWKFLRLPDGPFGEPRRRSTAKSDMSSEEMSAYVNDVIQYAETSIPGCRVRRPNEVEVDDVYAPEAA